MPDRLALLAICVFAWSAASPSTPPTDLGETVVGPGHSAHWRDPDRSGEGWVLEILDDSTALAYWFTFDEDGGQRWLMGVGEIVRDDDGARIEFPELVVTRGGEFGPGFDRDQVIREFVGQATMWFADCERGAVHYQAFGQQQTIELSRLTRTMGADCREPIHGLPRMPLTDDAGLSGSWYDPQRSGEGYSLQWLDRDEAVITWYTYDLNGNQMWLIAVGQRDGERVVFPEVSRASGARFGEAFDTNDVEFELWGELELELDCNTGLVEFSAESAEFGEGALNLTRLTGLERPDCPLTRPKLADLYDFELTEIPVTVPGGPTNNRATAMALDGTVVGYRPDQGRNRAWRWRPGEPEVEELPGINDFRTVLITPDGESIFTTRRDPPDGDALSPRGPIVWRDETGWEFLPGLSFHTSTVVGMSRDGSHLVGSGRVEPEDRIALWVWNEQEGQRAVAFEEDFLFTVSAVSDDGRVVIGIRIDFEGPSFFPRRDRATRWVDGEAEFLQDQFGAWLGFPFGCAAECRIIYGGLQSVDVDADHPHFDEAWIWTRAGGAEYLGKLPETMDSAAYGVTRGSADGSLLGGDFTVRNADNTLGGRAFLWTRATGMQPLAEILAEFDISDSIWDRTLVAAITPDGDRLLVKGRRLHNSESWAAIINLTPKRQPHE